MRAMVKPGARARPQVRLHRAIALAVLAAALMARPADAACRGPEGRASDFEGRRVFLWSPAALSQAKAGGPSPAKRAVIARADQALSGPTYSVTAKTRRPPGAGLHDYVSMGPYWWPDPGTLGGTPYVRRDGEMNPERSGAAFDATSMNRMSEAVEALALAYFLTEDARYARKAADLVRAWFLTPATRMSPNANFAQGIPGRAAGRPEGVLDTFVLLRVVEGVGLVAPAQVLSPDELVALKAWFSEYVDWMASSENGRGAAAKTNNHALWYDLQRAQFALFAGRPDVARAIATAFGEKRLAVQIAPHGALPEELARTRALHYSAFALLPATRLADLGRCVGVDVWAFETADGRSLRKAALFLAPYAGREREFPFPEKNPGPSDEMLEAMARAAAAYPDASLAKAAAELAHLRPASLLNLTVNAAAPASSRAAEKSR